MIKYTEIELREKVKVTVIPLTNKYCFVFQVQNKSYSLDEVTIVSNLDFDKLINQVKQKSNVGSQIKIISVTLISNEFVTIPNKMISQALRVNTSLAVFCNIYTYIDILTIQYQNHKCRQKVLQFIGQLIRQENISEVIHGSNLQFKDKKGENLIQRKIKQQKFTVITGASRGIGCRTAIQLAKQGKNLILTGRPGNKQLAQFAISLQNQYKIKTESLYLDLKCKQSCQKFAKKLSQTKVSIDCFIFNGAVGTKTSQQQTREGISKQQILVQVNSIGPVQLFQYLEKYYVINEETLLFVVSSVNATRPFKEMNPIDGCSKSMLQAWVQMIKQKYNVMIIYPGATDTEMFQKSTLSKFKQKQKLQLFISKLAKKQIISPQTMAKTIALVIKDNFRESLRGARIHASCGANTQYAPLPSV